MGGGDLHVPKEIWSPTGGFFADPKLWKRNTLLTVVAIAGLAAIGFNASIRMENRHAQPHGSIPSQRWYSAENFPQQQ